MKTEVQNLKRISATEVTKIDDVIVKERNGAGERGKKDVWTITFAISIEKVKLLEAFAIGRDSIEQADLKLCAWKQAALEEH